MSSISTQEFLMAACISSNCAEAIRYPFDTVKVRMQVYGNKWSSPFSCATSIVRTEGPQKLFAGLQAAFLRQTFFSTIRIGIFDVMNTRLKESKGVENITLLDRIGMGIFAGALGICIANPADTIKTKFQTGGLDKAGKPLFRNMVQATRSIWRKEGLRGFYASLPANIARNSVNSAAELASYDQIKTSMKKTGLMSDGILLYLFSSAWAGVIAAVV